MGDGPAVPAAVCMLVIAAIVATAVRVPTDPRRTGTAGPMADVDWWFDPARGAVCWVGKMPSWSGNDFVIDLDGNHSTGVTSSFQWDSKLGDFASHRTWEAGGGGGITNESGTGPSVISESTV